LACAHPHARGCLVRHGDARARAARAYRMFVVERTWIRHQYGLFLVAVACAVSLVRRRMFLTLPILTDEVNAFGAGPAGALARAVGRVLEPRWVAVVLCPSMLACALFRPLWYAARFERACDLVHMLGWLTRHGLNNFDGSRAIIEANYLTYLLRPVVVVASALSFRYEFSKQWKVHALRLLLDLPLNVYRSSSSAGDRRTTSSTRVSGDWRAITHSCSPPSASWTSRSRRATAPISRSACECEARRATRARKHRRRRRQQEEAARGGEQPRRRRARRRRGERPVSGFFLLVYAQPITLYVFLYEILKYLEP
jgi:hypothetical protein